MERRMIMAIIAVILVTIFVCSFIVVFLIYPRNYSTVYGTGSLVILDSNGNQIPVCAVAPGPNSTDVPLNVLIMVNQFRPISVGNLQLSPEVELSRVDENYGVASRRAIFYPVNLLKPATTYTVSGEIYGLYKSWVFTTTSKPASNAYVYYGSLVVSAIITAIAGSITTGIVWLKRKESRFLAIKFWDDQTGKEFAPKRLVEAPKRSVRFKSQRARYHLAP